MDYFWSFNIFVTVFVEQPMFVAGNAFLLKLYPFYPTWPFTLAWYGVLYSIFQFVIFAAIVKAFPGMFDWQTEKVS